MLVSLVLLALALPSATGATDRTLKRTVAHWSHVVALDARGTSLSAAQRHPRRMMLRAREFRADSLRAVYAVVGAEWARTGKARLNGRRALAARHAARAQRAARTGNRLIRSAGRLLR